MRKLKLGLAMVLLGLVVVFVVQNLQAVEMRFIVWATEVSLALPLLAAFLIGGLTGKPILRFLNNQRKSKSPPPAVEPKQAEAKPETSQPPADPGQPRQND